jgi:hypothetical protein
MKLNELRQLIREEISKLNKNSFEEEYKHLEQFINDKDFMESFIANARGIL